MVKMTFVRTIKYEGKLYPANSVVLVKEADVEELKKIGGIVIAEDKVEEAVAESKKSKAVVKEAPAKEKTTSYKGRKRG